ncbi:MAG: hypothetical protein KF784_01250 [Fimbriimonadaceae bacterium]|nr:hypothetical protein [Fimbriimonadaceae bacterium]
MKVAAVNWEIRQLRDEQGFFNHLFELIRRCADKGADLAVLPESVVLELCSLRPDLQGPSMIDWLLQFAEPFERMLIQLAGNHNIGIVGGSHFALRDGKPHNVSLYVPKEAPETAIAIPKVFMTQFEGVEWGVVGGSAVPNTLDPKIGVSICYDSEFPEAVRPICEAGALLLCVPAYTETIRGFQRVRWCCHARAVENQIYVVHASLVGALGREPIPRTHGSSAILTPSIELFPESAVLAETPFNVEAVAVADLDFEILLDARTKGDVRNWEDWQSSKGC